MKKRFFLLLSAAVIWSCATREKPGDSFSRGDFKDSTVLTAEVIDFAPVDDAIYYEVVRDSLLFIATRNGDPFFVEIYNLNTRLHLAQFASKGNGPGEFLSCRIRYETNLDSYFTLLDVVGKRAAVYSIDSVLTRGVKYIPRQVRLPDGVLNLAAVSPDTLIAHNSYHFNGDGMVNKADCLLKIAVNDDKAHTQKMAVDGDLFTANVSQVHIFPSPSNDEIWVADFHKDKIDIYDRDLKLRRSMIGPDRIEPKYTFNGIWVSFDGNQYVGYYGGFYTKESIYLIYQGLNGIPFNDSFRTKVEVFKLSWRGELLHRYKLDRWVYSIKLSKDEKYLYGVSDDNEMQMPHLVRYQLK